MRRPGSLGRVLGFIFGVTAAGAAFGAERAVVGAEFEYKARRGDTLAAIGARFAIEASSLAKRNRLSPSARLRPGSVLAIDNRHIVPAALENGILINLPQRLLFHFEDGRLVAWYPVGLGQPGSWQTPPSGSYKVARVFDALPPDRLDYRPDPRSRSAEEMVTHLAREQEMLVQMMNEGKIDYRDPVPEDFGEMRALWKKCTSELRDRLKNLDDAGWNRPVKFFMGGKQINETTTNEMLWGFLLDMIHHRGQLSTYIRPMGGKVPSIYGPSADAPPA